MSSNIGYSYWVNIFYIYLFVKCVLFETTQNSKLMKVAGYLRIFLLLILILLTKLLSFRHISIVWFVETY